MLACREVVFPPFALTCFLLSLAVLSCCWQLLSAYYFFSCDLGEYDGDEDAAGGGAGGGGGGGGGGGQLDGDHDDQLKQVICL